MFSLLDICNFFQSSSSNGQTAPVSAAVLNVVFCPLNVLF